MLNWQKKAKLCHFWPSILRIPKTLKLLQPDLLHRLKLVSFCFCRSKKWRKLKRFYLLIEMCNLTLSKGPLPWVGPGLYDPGRFLGSSWILLSKQGCRPWVCRVCHGTPRFWQISNPISTRGDRLCPPNCYWHPRIFRLSDGPGLSRQWENFHQNIATSTFTLYYSVAVANKFFAPRTLLLIVSVI